MKPAATQAAMQTPRNKIKFHINRNRQKNFHLPKPALQAMMAAGTPAPAVTREKMRKLNRFH